MANIASEMAIVENAAQLAVVANADRIESDLSRFGASALGPIAFVSTTCWLATPSDTQSTNDSIWTR
jgi:hypothetical protein